MPTLVQLAPSKRETRKKDTQHGSYIDSVVSAIDREGKCVGGDGGGVKKGKETTGNVSSISQIAWGEELERDEGKRGKESE